MSDTRTPGLVTRITGVVSTITRHYVLVVAATVSRAIMASITWLAGIRDCGLYHRVTQASGDAAVPVPSNPVGGGQIDTNRSQHERSDHCVGALHGGPRRGRSPGGRSKPSRWPSASPWSPSGPASRPPTAPTGRSDSPASSPPGSPARPGLGHRPQARAGATADARAQSCLLIQNGRVAPHRAAPLPERAVACQQSPPPVRDKGVSS
jgi:hypothetical protein